MRKMGHIKENEMELLEMTNSISKMNDDNVYYKREQEENKTNSRDEMQNKMNNLIENSRNRAEKRQKEWL